MANEINWDGIAESNGFGGGLRLLQQFYSEIHGADEEKEEIDNHQGLSSVDSLIVNGGVRFFDFEMAFAVRENVADLVINILTVLSSKQIDTYCLSKSFMEFLSVDDRVFKDMASAGVSYGRMCLMILRWLEHSGSENKLFLSDTEIEPSNLVPRPFSDDIVRCYSINHDRGAQSGFLPTSCLVKQSRILLSEVDSSFSDFYMNDCGYSILQKNIRDDLIDKNSTLIFLEVYFIKYSSKNEGFTFSEYRFVFNELNTLSVEQLCEVNNNCGNDFMDELAAVLRNT
ncbi:hypothetical protein [Photobacterium kishitanii]|uniref:Uncharacterized protein n=1 Tax=Photobacterium kishitanii TaxID=318456 RepID=A0A2T3KMA8_9GAMM|nr:hypothetical protein [Photobacterium kishitanii]PSV00921.1 hypothetical protein C9J27_02520 [Photobacterium kishitanii]